MDRGITLAGGGALLQGMEQRMREECQMPCQIDRVAADLRRGRLRPLARGVRGDPPDAAATPAAAGARRGGLGGRRCTASRSAGAGRSSSALDRRLAGPALGALLRGRERPAARDPARRRHGLRADRGGRRAGAEAGPRPRSTGSTRPSTPAARTTSCSAEVAELRAAGRRGRGRDRRERASSASCSTSTASAGARRATTRSPRA